MRVVTQHAGRGLLLVEAGLRHRIAARLRAPSLDLALATGVPPERSRPLALRARYLVRPTTRRWVARSLERVLADGARQPGLPPAPLAAARRRAVAGAADDLEALIARLRRPGPVAARGVAQAVALLRDGAGPLHGGTAEPDLGTVLRKALAHLDDPVLVPGNGHRAGPDDPFLDLV